MRAFHLLPLLPLTLLAHKSDITLNFNAYNNASSEYLVQGANEFEASFTPLSLHAKLKYLYSNQYDEKRYFRVDEFYLRTNSEAYQFELGKIIKYLGELEGYNISDIFNPKEYLWDAFDGASKDGSYYASLSHYFEASTLEIGAKLYEANQAYPKPNTPYAPFAIHYDKHLQSAAYDPSYYLKYTFSTEWEQTLLFWHGYDTKRTFIPINATTLAQDAYRVNKLISTSNFLYEDFIFKLEASFSDVIDNAQVEDYTQIGVGVEKGFYDIYGVDATLYGEYYYYDKVAHIDISELYNEDIFLALKLNLNDAKNTQLKLGALCDTQTNERLFKGEFTRRIVDGLLFRAEWLRFLPKDGSLLSRFENTSRTTFALTYSF